MQTYAFLDTGSTISVIMTAAAKKLNLEQNDRKQLILEGSTGKDARTTSNSSLQGANINTVQHSKDLRQGSTEQS